jgi:aryl-alcohol dehydrogenase-like predicted oxidoreductase
LHNPDAENINTDHALDVISELKIKGRIRLVGISTDSERVLLTALSDKRLDVIQCRLPQSPGMRDALVAASDRGLAIIAREILGGVRIDAAPPTPAIARSQVRTAVSSPFVTAALIGTTKQIHLAHAIASLERQSGPDVNRR